MQLMINAHKEPNDEIQEDKEHDKEFKEVYKGVKKRGTFISTRPTIYALFCSHMHKVKQRLYSNVSLQSSMKLVVKLTSSIYIQDSPPA